MTQSIPEDVLAVPLAEAQRLLGISKRAMSGLIDRGELAMFRTGKATTSSARYIPVSEIRDYLDRQIAASLAARPRVSA